MALNAVELQRMENERCADEVTMIAMGRAGHTGGGMSCLDVLTCLYYGVMRVRPGEPDWAERDRFLLSTGHSVEGYLVILADLGFFEKAELRTFSQPGCRLIGHSTNKVPGIELCTGALLAYFNGVREKGKPHFLIAKTIKGKGLPFAENRID